MSGTPVSLNTAFDTSFRRVSLLWLFSLIVMAALAVSSDIIVDNQVTRSETFAEYVNIAGRQRMWTAKIALHATEFVVARTVTERETYARRLRQSLDTMRIEQNLIMQETSYIPEIVEIFLEGEYPVEKLNQSYWAAVEALLALPSADVSLDSPQYSYIRNNSQFLITRLDGVVLALLDFNSHYKQQLQQINTLRIFVVIAVIVLQYFFAFRPAIARLQGRASDLVHEIAERKRVEAELRASETRFRLLVEAAPVGIFQTDIRGETIWVNARWKEIMGLTDEEATRSRWIEAIHPDDRDAAVTEEGRQRESGHPVSMDYRIVRRDGAVAWLHINAMPMVDEADQRVAMIGTVTDVTERKLAEEAAHKLEAERQRVRVLGEFIRDTSHDLRTPLTVIKSGLYLLTRLTDVERMHAKAKVIEEHVDYLNIVINQLQEMAVLDTLTDLTLKPMLIQSLLLDVTNEVKRHPDSKGKSVTVEFADNLPSVLSAPDKLFQAFRAVLENARRYTAEDGLIRVTAAHVGSNIVVTVTDNGIGIPADQLPHVFERFYKVDKARSIGGGAGLGLPMAKRIIDLHGGNIAIDSTLGSGTTVRVMLPAVPV